MSYYIIEAQNAGDSVHELITCSECKYLGRHYDRDFLTCSNPLGMAVPTPKGFCNYAIRKPIYERDEEKQ